jgi:hypothetical protein
MCSISIKCIHCQLSCASLTLVIVIVALDVIFFKVICCCHLPIA